jgi:hypothetical protein
MSRGDPDPSAQVAAELRARLRAMGGEELVELCAELLSTYVVEGVQPLARAGEGAELAADGAGEESFAQLLKRLKATSQDPALERFFVDGENISVRIDGQGILPVTEYRRPASPPASPGVPVQPRRESVPGASTSVYNRSLYEAPPQPARPATPASPARPAPPPARSQPPGQPPPQQPAGAAQPQKPEAEQPKNDRFSLIELE